MQPTNDQLSEANTSNLVNCVSILHLTLGFIKQKAIAEEDGNTVALINRISRDINSILEKYNTVDINKFTENTKVQEQPVSEQDPLFTAQSYEKTAAQDVNQAPYPITDEDSGAPFVSKSKLTKSDDLDALTKDPYYKKPKADI